MSDWYCSRERNNCLCILPHSMSLMMESILKQSDCAHFSRKPAFFWNYRHTFSIAKHGSRVLESGIQYSNLSSQSGWVVGRISTSQQKSNRRCLLGWALERTGVFRTKHRNNGTPHYTQHSNPEAQIRKISEAS